MGYSSTTCLDSYHFKYLTVCLSLFCKYNICVQSCFSIHIIQILFHTWSNKTFKNTVVSVILLWKVSWIYAYVTLNLISNCSSQICWFCLPWTGTIFSWLPFSHQETVHNIAGKQQFPDSTQYSRQTTIPWQFTI